MNNDNERGAEPAIEEEEEREGCCEATELHLEAISHARETLLTDPEIIDRLSELFKVLGDPTRIRILQALHDTRLCVCDIAETLNMTQSAISHQLRILKHARMVKNRRAGKVVYYSLTDDHIKTLFEIAFEHIMED